MIANGDRARSAASEDRSLTTDHDPFDCCTMGSEIESYRAHQLALDVWTRGLALLRMGDVLSACGKRPLLVQLVCCSPIDCDISRQRNESGARTARDRQQSLPGGLIA